MPALRTLRFALVSLIAAGCVLVSACQTDAITGKSTLNLYSYEEEKALGDANVQPILAELGGLYPDYALQRYVTEVGKKVEAAGRSRLRGEAGFPDWDFKFYVVNSGMINAFALPGGHVFVTRGIMLRLKDESELAGLLGHEVTHVFARHSAEAMSKMTLMLLPVALLGAFEETEGAAVVGVIAIQVLGLKYGRDAETESDKNGMRFAVRAGYHPRGIINVMDMLDRYVDEHGGGGPEFLSTHPDPGNRVQYLTDQMKSEYPDAAGAGYARNAAQYDGAIVDMRAAQPAYDLADRGDAEMALGFKEIADNKNAAAAERHYRTALDLYHQAVSMQPDHAILHVNVASACFYLEDYRGAEKSIAHSLRLAPRDFWPNFLGGLVAIKRERYEIAEERLGAALNLIPDSPVGVFYLAIANDRQGQRNKAVANYKRAYDLFGGEGDLAEAARQRLIALGEPDPKKP